MTKDWYDNFYRQALFGLVTVVALQGATHLVPIVCVLLLCAAGFIAIWKGYDAATPKPKDWREIKAAGDEWTTYFAAKEQAASLDARDNIGNVGPRFRSQ